MNVSTLAHHAGVVAPTPHPAAEPLPDEAVVHRRPGPLATPAVNDGSAAASAKLKQASAIAGVLHAAMLSSPEDYSGLINRGVLDDAIEDARDAHSLIDDDKNLDNDGFMLMVETNVMWALQTLRNYGTPSIVSPIMRDEMLLAKAAADNAANGLALLAVRPVPPA